MRGGREKGGTRETVGVLKLGRVILGVAPALRIIGLLGFSTVLGTSKNAKKKQNYF